jgi:hypothetical protein
MFNVKISIVSFSLGNQCFTVVGILFWFLLVSHLFVVSASLSSSFINSHDIGELLSAPVYAFQDKYRCSSPVISPPPSATITSSSSSFTSASSSSKEEKKKLNNFHLRGTSLGGFLVLEPWITPSLFYQFLETSEIYGNNDETKNHIAIDSMTFCRVLGGKEANRQLRIHWNNWVTEKEISQLAMIGVETVRIPVADWMFLPYEPFTNGCWDGSLQQLNRAIDLCHKYNMTVLLDLHAMKGSQVRGSLFVLCVFPSFLSFLFSAFSF